MKSEQTKMIRITSMGIVTTSRGRVVTPIARPYRESVDMIFKMLSVNKPTPVIYERLANGREVQLNLWNYDKDNELVKPEVSRPITASVNNAEKIADTQDAGQQTYQVNNNKQYGKNKKRNKHNKGNYRSEQEFKKEQPVKSDDAPDTEIPNEETQKPQITAPLTDDTEQV